jgi:hypothetical protein
VNSWLILRMASSTVFWHRLSCELVWCVLQPYLSALLLIGCLFCTLIAVCNYPIADVRNDAVVSRFVPDSGKLHQEHMTCSKQCLVTVLQGESVCFIYIYRCLCVCVCVCWRGWLWLKIVTVGCPFTGCTDETMEEGCQIINKDWQHTTFGIHVRLGLMYETWHWTL